jgi:3-carboxy-cis,cis-muconate cycloisomerase
MGPMNEPPISSHFAMPLHASPAMRALMSDRARLQRMLDFEAALARAEAAVGVISATGASAIAQACKAAQYDIAALIEAQAASGDIASAMIAALTQRVAASELAAANFVHWGACSQDIIDTALMLDLRAGIEALVSDLDLAIKGFTTLAGRHRRTLSVARISMQHALPMPFGLKLAGYAAALGRSRERLTRLRREALVLQFGGTAGTLAALGEHGLAVSERMAALLDLNLPDAPWHSHRDRLAEVAACFGILAGTCGKIARDIALMMQTEVGEVSVSHNGNPAAVTLSAATVAPNLVATLIAAQAQEHERAPGGWHTDWVTVPALALATSGALAAVVAIAQGLEIDVERLRQNLDLTGGQIMAEAVSYALGAKIDRAQAHALVDELSEQATRDKRPLKEALLNDTRVRSHLSVAEIEKLFIPLTYQGSAQIFIERLVVESQMRAPRRSEPRVEARPEPRPELQLKPNPVETVLAGAPAPAMTDGPDFAKQQTPVAAQANATAPAIAAYAGMAESPTPTGQVPAATLTQPAPDKLQWPGALLHIFTNAAKQQGEPSDRDKSNLP